MELSLKSTIIAPENKEIKSVIILLHGYGGDGKDISLLSLNWKRFLPNTIFICPDGHEKCEINPNGYQWFDLTNDDPNYILNESLKAEKKINQFLNEVKKEYRLENEQIKNAPRLRRSHVRVLAESRMYFTFRSMREIFFEFRFRGDYCSFVYGQGQRAG